EIQAIKKIAEKHAGAGGVRLLWGDTKQGDRGQVVEDFQKDPDVRVFIAQTQTGGVGITLTAADTMIFYSLDYSYGNHAQAMARIHRIGQKFPVTYIYLLASGTIDEAVYETLQGKRSMAEFVLDRGVDGVAGMI
ncbi:MAG: SWF/SNF helicase family protein, partial [Candidatus Hydrogenedentes bacterium]|nr:SWF/SNF helicase family protein [Candidatus Hydrogenedentota bacterium]